LVVLRGFEFSLREFAGSLGDFGTLIPFTVGYIVLSGFKPTGLLLGIGITNVFLALAYRLPIPVQPKKVIGSVALAERWPMNRVIGAGFAVGLIWILLSLSTRLSSYLEKVPNCVVKGVQLGLAFSLALAAAEMIETQLLLAVPIMAIAFILLKSRVLPSSIFLMLFGLLYALFTGDLDLSSIKIGLSVPELHLFSLNDIIYGFLYAGFAQLFLTLTNAVVATVALIHELFPDRRDITPRNLLANMGVMNVVTPFIGGMPLCHGSGGLAAQYLFGARTGGAILMEGLLEISLGLFFSESLLVIFSSFPMFIVGVMLLMTSLELGRVAFKVGDREGLIPMLFTALVSTSFNVAFGFLAGLLLYLSLKRGILEF